MGPATLRLLRRVALRQAAAVWARRLWVAALAGLALFAALLLVARLTALVPDRAVWWSLLLPAAVLTPLFARRRDPAAAARAVDQSEKTGDLFLTAALIGNAPGEFQPLVLERAEARAGAIRPGAAAPFRLRRRAGALLLVLAAVAAGHLWLPRLDPWGQAEARARRSEESRRLAAMKKATAERLEKLAAAEEKESKETKQAVEQLVRELAKLKGGDPQGNLRRMAEQQKKLGELWRETSQQQLRDLAERGSLAQSLGGEAAREHAQASAALQEGNAEPFKKEIDQLKRLAEKLAKADAKDAEALKKTLKKRVEELARSLQGAPQVSEALRRALEQLAMSDNPELTEQALAAARQSKYLSERELTDLARRIKNKKLLEEALEALRLARELAERGKLGEAGEGASLEDYLAMYRKMCEGQGNGPPGQPGQGDGKERAQAWGKRPEDPNAKTGFRTERSPTQLQEGRMLLQWKAGRREVGDPGKANPEYQRGVKQLKQDASEAVTKERVPAGYHESIRKYFDDLERGAVEGPGKK